MRVSTYPNQLLRVQNLVAANAQTADIDNQEDNNYQYNSIGQNLKYPRRGRLYLQGQRPSKPSKLPRPAQNKTLL